MSDKLVPIIINLSAAKQENINESFLRMFGGAVKWILNGMFGCQSYESKGSFANARTK